MKNLNTRLLRFTKLLEFSVALCLMELLHKAILQSPIPAYATITSSQTQLPQQLSVHRLKSVLTENLLL